VREQACVCVTDGSGVLHSTPPYPGRGRENVRMQTAAGEGSRWWWWRWPYSECLRQPIRHIPPGREVPGGDRGRGGRRCVYFMLQVDV
jgi:hypothetical protein